MMLGTKTVTFYEEGEGHRCVSKGGPTKRIEHSCLGEWGYFSVARDFCRGLVNRGIRYRNSTTRTPTDKNLVSIVLLEQM